MKGKRIDGKTRKRSAQAKKSKPTPANPLPPICFAAVGLAILTLLVFGRVVTFPFINFDDPAYVFEQPQIAQGVSWAGVIWSFTHVHSGNWHPLTSLSHMFDCQLFGLNAGAHHLVNLLLHAANGVLLFFLLLMLTNAIWRSAFVAAVFVIHPLRVESVAWIAERKDVLSGLFFMLTLIRYVRYARAPSLGRYLVVALLYALGLMAKPMLITIPIVLLLLDWWPLNRFGQTKIRQLLLEKVPFFGLAAAASIATLLAQTEAISTVEQLPLSVRTANAVVSYARYIVKLFWPSNLSLIYPYPAHIAVQQVILAALLLITVSVFVFMMRDRARYLTTGWSWYLIMLLPVIGLIQVGRQAYADRYTYLPHIGLSIAMTWGIAQLSARWPYRHIGLPAAAIIVLIASSAASFNQLSYWRDAEVLWEHSIAVTENNYIAHNFLADLLMRKNRVEDSLMHAQEAVRLRPDNADAQNNLALALFRDGRLSEAAQHWEYALHLAPHDVNTECNYGWLLATAPAANLRNGERAVQLTQDVLQRSGRDNPAVLRAAAAALAEREHFAEAISTAEEALRLARQQQNSAFIQDITVNLVNYRQGRPLRDPGKF